MTEQCNQKVWKDDWHKHVQCSRKAKKDGYCTQHHPDSVKVREVAADRKWKEKRANDPWVKLSKALDEKRELKEKNGRLVEAIKEHISWAESQVSCDDLEEALEENSD